MSEAFILLDDARPLAENPAPARLYREPRATFVARRGDEVAPALAAAREALAAGHHVAGQIAYDAGLALEPRLAPLARAGDAPLVWLAAFDGCETISAGDVPQWLAARIAENGLPPTHLSPLRPTCKFDEYARRFAALRDAIEAGDIYQANLTFALAGRWRGDPLAIYAAIRGRAAAGHGGIVFDGTDWTLSFSPELFFAVMDGTVTMKPMKGTRPRGATPEEDSALADALFHSAKDRAENLMITDLMRNDISRVAVPGSVRVAAPFAIETYPTVHQMVTTITADLAPGRDAGAVLRALMPCGSITGAPKIRAMELIHREEDAARGVYCGAVGRFDPDGDAAFNVAIRTLRLDAGGDAILGVGSAITAGSDARAEWDECLVKGRFASPDLAPFHLIETMHFDPLIGVPMVERHLERLKQSAHALGFACDRHAIRNDIQAFCFTHREPARLRVMLAQDGSWTLEGGAMPDPLTQPVPCMPHDLPVEADDWRLSHKTSLRDFYDAARFAAAGLGAEEAVLVRQDGRVTEGSFTNIFVERDGAWLTPPASLGLLPGVMRQKLLDEGVAREAELTLDDLKDGFHIGNALRGMMRARLI
ncbi:aminodeoxychorismate synthase component I [Croceicoccus sp. YJ47]|uniref:aminodeoxychorismate synthase component I n=1 Tax=Croceicoccus sp. YJ47 TaxID=2798724 RepID=UPI001924B502|nr:aminodeoxychorismate synthase component I [Croceicoccus sp. YJ47]QQN73026.1 aminodeoxychorismate synthase component I [Croceicoccus sp. YJ47]